MYLTDTEFNILSIFADGEAHEKWELVGMGVALTQLPQKKFWKKFKRKFLEYNWVKMVERSKNGNDVFDTFQITKKGDNLLRSDAIKRGGEQGFYKNFDRTPQSMSKLSKPDNIRSSSINRGQLI